jgi:hypothetical protein
MKRLWRRRGLVRVPGLLISAICSTGISLKRTIFLVIPRKKRHLGNRSIYGIHVKCYNQSVIKNRSFSIVPTFSFRCIYKYMEYTVLMYVQYI